VVEVGKVVDMPFDVELVAVWELMVDEAKPEIEVESKVNDCDVIIDDDTSVIDDIVVEGVDIELPTLSVLVVNVSREIESLSVTAEIKDEESETDSTEDDSMPVVKLGISVDVAKEIGVVATVETGVAEAAEAVVSGLSIVACVIVGCMIVELSNCRMRAAPAFDPVEIMLARASRIIAHNITRVISS